MKALIITNLTKRFQAGHFTMINPLKELGFEVHWASNFSEYKGKLEEIDIKTHHIDFIRNPLNIRNIIAYRQLVKLLKVERYDVIHCNSPIGGLLGRICGKRVGIKKIIYTAHGFHFYKGGSVVRNIIFRNIERVLAKLTDCIITINNEDFNSAKEFRLRKNGNVEYIPGMGIDISYYKDIYVDKNKKRLELGFYKNEKIILMTGDLIKRKNYEAAIRAISELEDDIHCLICGVGKEEETLRLLVNQLGVVNRIHFLGFRNDINELLKISNIFLFTSFQEGLSRSLMEAMASGNICVASQIRGNTDLIENGLNGYLVNPYDYTNIKLGIKNALACEKKEIIKNSLEKIDIFDISNIEKIQYGIYRKNIV